MIRDRRVRWNWRHPIDHVSGSFCHQSEIHPLSTLRGGSALLATAKRCLERLSLFQNIVGNTRRFQRDITLTKIKHRHFDSDFTKSVSSIYSPKVIYIRCLMFRYEATFGFIGVAVIDLLQASWMDKFGAKLRLAICLCMWSEFIFGVAIRRFFCNWPSPKRATRQDKCLSSQTFGSFETDKFGQCCRCQAYFQ
jgi:hypothetical protein